MSLSWETSMLDLKESILTLLFLIPIGTLETLDFLTLNGCMTIWLALLSNALIAAKILLLHLPLKIKSLTTFSLAILLWCVFKILKSLQRNYCKNFHWNFVDCSSATSSDGTAITLSDHYGFRGVYCMDDRTIGSIPAPVTAVSTGQSPDDTNNISGASSLESFVVFSLIGAVLLFF